jgi:hypothetical protein
MSSNVVFSEGELPDILLWFETVHSISIAIWDGCTIMHLYAICIIFGFVLTSRSASAANRAAVVSFDLPVAVAGDLFFYMGWPSEGNEMRKVSTGVL